MQSVKRSPKSRGPLGVSRWIFEHPYSVFRKTCTAPTREATFSKKHPKKSTLGRPWGPPVVLLDDFWAPRDAVGESLGLTFGKPSKTQRFLMVFQDFLTFKRSKCQTLLKSEGAGAPRNPIF